ncbi:MAG: phosphatidate cytidylyltransferase [bacterium]
MSETDLRNYILLLTLIILLGFGFLVLLWTLIWKIKGKSVKSIWVKYLAWFAIIPPLIIPLVFSRIAFQIVTVILSMGCFREYSNATGLWKDKKLTYACYLSIACIYFPVFDKWYGLFQAMPIYVIAFLLVIPIMRGEYEHMIQKTCLSVLGVAYFGWFLSHISYMRNLAGGAGYIFYLFFLVESNDAFGYLWGSLLGTHKLVPRISPNKTIEGALGGLFSLMILGYLFRFLVPTLSIPHILFLSYLISIFGICGDLTISFIKRDLKIKDMGDLIPGHGGLLDRFDSLIFTAPLFFHFIRYFYA